MLNNTATRKALTAMLTNISTALIELADGHYDNALECVRAVDRTQLEEIEANLALEAEERAAANEACDDLVTEGRGW